MHKQERTESLAKPPSLSTLKNPLLELNGLNAKQVIAKVRTAAKLKEACERHCYYCGSKSCGAKQNVTTDFMTYFQSPSFIYRTCDDFVSKHNVWIDRDYYRLNVYDYIDKFAGWWAIEEFLKYCGKYEPFFFTMFKTGGRVKEALSLQKDFFKVDKAADCLVVTGMLLEKHYQRDKDTGETFTVHATRKPFPARCQRNLAPS